MPGRPLEVALPRVSHFEGSGEDPNTQVGDERRGLTLV